MDKKTRLIVFSACALLFFIITPFILLYSTGYRIDLVKWKIVATGGIYVKALPQEANITINSKTINKSGIFSNYVFLQNLLPKQYDVLIKKDGYYDYQKNLTVKEKEVTKLEHVILIKKENIFEPIKNDIDYFSISPDGNNLLTANYKDLKFEITSLANQQRKSFPLSSKTLIELSSSVEGIKISDLKWSGDSSKALMDISGNYFLLDLSLENPKITHATFLNQAKEIYFNPQNSSEIFFIKNQNLFSNKKLLAILKNVASYQIANQSIIWFSYDGFLYNSDIEGKTSSKISSVPIKSLKNNSYKIRLVSNNILLYENESLFLLNQNSKAFENSYSPVKDLKTSPNGQKVIYLNDYEILLSFLNFNNPDKIFLNRFSEKIVDCYWINDNYLIFSMGNKIIISETDNRGNINTIELPKTILLADNSSINIENPTILFRQQDKKLYVLTQNKLLVSERLIP